MWNPGYRAEIAFLSFFSLVGKGGVWLKYQNLISNSGDRGNMQQIAIFVREEQTMNSREMADLVEKRHDSVKRTIETLVTAGAISKPQIVDGEKAANNVVEKLYVFGKRDSYVIVAQLSPTFTARLVDRWQELEQKQMVALPDFSNPAEAARAWATQYEARQVLEAKVTDDAPKVKFAEIIRAMDGVCHIGDFCKTMGIGRNKLFRMMKADKILMENRMPYQKYVDKGYFSVIEQKPYTNSKGETHVTFTTMVTGAGQVFLAKRYAHLAGEV